MCFYVKYYFDRSGRDRKNARCFKGVRYKVVRSLNNELKQKGYIVIAGKVSRKFFEERFYGCSSKSEAEGEKIAEKKGVMNNVG